MLPTLLLTPPSKHRTSAKKAFLPLSKLFPAIGFHGVTFTAAYFAPFASRRHFAAGFLMRPIGGCSMGHTADTQGRKRFMLISVTLMCAGALVARLPIYASNGFLGLVGEGNMAPPQLTSAI